MALRMPTGSRGFTYLGLMLFMAVAGIGLTMAGKVWHTEVQREKEKELLFIGDQFRQAIKSYYDSTPLEVKQYPPTLQELLRDRRFPKLRRHLRRIFPDPITGSTEWGLVKEQGRIIGVYSQSQDHPLMKFAFNAAALGTAAPKTYADWRFIYKAEIPGTAVAVVPGTQVPANPLVTKSDVPPVPMPIENPKQDDPCDIQAAADSAICQNLCQPFQDICNDCNISQAQRWQACKKNKPLMQLITK